ncbi:MAG: Fe-S cluster assembly protein SufD [Candidatus Pelagibacter sp. TMED153]|nr:MAG: Fe-S cluster assembly protein SufD [Candidatus Pelagibacter sp. TMED153]|tara:strand:+ start:795 stop:2054 length:1260 start_codon:yes stop_codon:yes gene_type:complete
MLEFKIHSNEIDKIGKFTKEEKDFRLKNLNYFNDIGFPNKKNEDWKFSDLREIVFKNFKKLDLKLSTEEKQKVDFIKDFEHNYIVIVNGELTTSDFKFEDKNKIKLQSFVNEKLFNKQEINPLVNLNHALSDKGFFLEIEENYKLKKILVVYYLYTEDLDENILNSKNKIKVGKNSELHLLDFIVNKSNKNFFNNVYEDIVLENSATLKNICVQNQKSSGYFHKYSKNKLSTKSNYTSFIFPSGLKFNKLDLEFNLEGENSECNLQSASFLDQNDHQEIKTRINHFSPNCKSYQKVKNVLNSESKGVYQGKIFVKDVAQKTDAYQLSKAILLSERSEFDSKPELEIYADDVKCSHGSSSGSLDEDSIYYLMTRGLSKKESVKLLVNGFLSEVIDSIKNNSIKNFIKIKLEDQLNEYKKH